MIRRALLAGFLLTIAALPARADIVYLSGLAPVSAVSDSDTTFWCDTASGCGPGVNLKRVTAPQIANYAIGKLTATAPLFLSGNNLQLLIDNTLSIVGNQLHVVGGGGGGGGITQLVGPVTAGPGSGVQTSAIAPSGVTAGTYACPTTTVNIEGRVTSIASSSCGGTGFTQLTNDVLAGPGSGSQVATVVGLQSRPVLAAAPSTGQFLGWNGSAWLPVTGSGGTSGVTANYTVANSCTGASCSPVTQCWVLSAGLVSSISTGACSSGGTHFRLTNTNGLRLSNSNGFRLTNGS